MPVVKLELELDQVLWSCTENNLKEDLLNPINARAEMITALRLEWRTVFLLVSGKAVPYLRDREKALYPVFMGQTKMQHHATLIGEG